MAIILYIGVKLFIFFGIPAAIIYFIVIGLLASGWSNSKNDENDNNVSCSSEPIDESLSDTRAEDVDAYEKYYSTLEVDSNASQDDLKSAYRTLCKVWHPDRFSNDLELETRAVAKMQEINEAYSFLLKNKHNTI